MWIIGGESWKRSNNYSSSGIKDDEQNSQKIEKIRGYKR